jgi:hypothetical protein
MPEARFAVFLAGMLPMAKNSTKKVASVSSLPSGDHSAVSIAQTFLNAELPEPSLDHLERMSDDTGLFQHARFILPDRKEGYCADDNARAVIVMTKYFSLYSNFARQRQIRLFDTYLSFILHSQKKDGSIQNFMNFNRTWRKSGPPADAFGRVLWAFGTVISKPPLPSYLPVAQESFDRAIWHLQRCAKGARAMAYSILGISEYLSRFPDADDIKQQLKFAADQLMAQYKQNSSPDWQWFEQKITYDNGVMPQALFVAATTLGNDKYLQVAKKGCEFLLANTFNGNHFSFVGCHGWFERGRTKASFDQQPIEAASMVLMLKAAYDATQDGKLLKLQRRAFDWFLGENDLHIPLYDSKTKGCSDALTPDGVNVNQGAESILSFLLALLTMLESQKCKA